MGWWRDQVDPQDPGDMARHQPFFYSVKGSREITLWGHSIRDRVIRFFEAIPPSSQPRYHLLFQQS